MKELEFPFDTDYIISKRKRIKRELLSSAAARIKKKIAILGGYTTSNIKLILELFLLNNGIEPVFYESEYNQYYKDAMFSNTMLEAFHPDVIYICTCNRNVIRYPEITDGHDIVEKLLSSENAKFTAMWDRLAEVYHCPVIQNNMEMPFYRLMGNKDASDIHGAVNFLSRLNMKFYEYAQSHENFFICDINYIP